MINRIQSLNSYFLLFQWYVYIESGPVPFASHWLNGTGRIEDQRIVVMVQQQLGPFQIFHLDGISVSECDLLPDANRSIFGNPPFQAIL